MKRCPQCNRVEIDEALKFCRADGATLVSESSSPGSEAGTARLGSASQSNEIETSILHFFLFNLYRFKGKHALAVEEFAKNKEARDEAEAATLTRKSFTKGGWPAFLATVTKEHARVKSSPYTLATFYAELGDKDQAFAALNEAIAKCDQFIGFIKVDPAMKPLQTDPRFQPLLRRVGLPE